MPTTTNNGCYDTLRSDLEGVNYSPIREDTDGILRLHAAIPQTALRADRENNQLTNVNLISIGEARGHGILVDEGTLDSLMETAALKAGKVRAYITHGDMCTFDRLTTEAGFFEQPRIKGEHLRADFTALDSFIKYKRAQSDTLFELAEKAPDQFGVSITFSGRQVWTTEEGNEIESDEKPDDALNELPSIRVDELFSADFVDYPAATRSLFRATEQTPHQTMSELPEDFNLAAHDVTLRKSILEAERERIESILALADPHFKRSRRLQARLLHPRATDRRRQRRRVYGRLPQSPGRSRAPATEAGARDAVRWGAHHAEDRRRISGSPRAHQGSIHARRIRCEAFPPSAIHLTTSPPLLSTPQTTDKQWQIPLTMR